MGGSPKNEFIENCIKLYSSYTGINIHVAVETGTYFGQGAINLSSYFETVHTIELSKKWYDESLRTLKDFKNIYCHLGDSATILDKLNSRLNFPVAFYLDAHYSGGTTAFGIDEVPLLRELQIINKRKLKDLIIIDDYRLMGKKGICGDDNHPNYPLMNFDWSNINIDSILKTLNFFEGIHWEIQDDRIIIITNTKIK